MRDRLQTQLFGPYLVSFSAHSYGYELSNDPRSVLKLLDFRFGPILGQSPSVPCGKSCQIILEQFAWCQGAPTQA